MASLYADLLEPNSKRQGTGSGEPVQYQFKRPEDEAKEEKKSDGARLFQPPIRRPAMNQSQRARPRPALSASSAASAPSAPAAPAAAAAISSPLFVPSQHASSAARHVSTADDWVNEDEDDYYTAEFLRHQRESKQRAREEKKRKKQRGKHNANVASNDVDWDAIYDPTQQPPTHGVYGKSEEKVHADHDWKQRLHAHQLSKKKMKAQQQQLDDTLDNNNNNNNNNSATVNYRPPGGYSFAPPPELAASASVVPVPVPAAHNEDDDDDDDDAEYVPPPPSAEAAAAAAPPPPPPPPAMATDMRDMQHQQQHAPPPPPPPFFQPPPYMAGLPFPPPPPGMAMHFPGMPPAPQAPVPPQKPQAKPAVSSSIVISAGPVLRIPPAAAAPAKQAFPEKEQQQAQTDKQEEADIEAPRSKRPGQKGFAERHMAKLGWKKGEGLGSNKNGIITALKHQTTKRKKRSDAEGGGWVGPAGGIGRIVGGKRRKVEGEPEADTWSEVARFDGMLAGVDVQAEMVGGDLMQNLGETMAAYGHVERLYIHQAGENDVFVKFTSPLSAYRAIQASDGKDFFRNGNTVKSRFWNADKFDEADYGA